VAKCPSAGGKWEWSLCNGVPCKWELLARCKDKEYWHLTTNGAHCQHASAYMRLHAGDVSVGVRHLSKITEIDTSFFSLCCCETILEIIDNYFYVRAQLSCLLFKNGITFWNSCPLASAWLQHVRRKPWLSRRPLEVVRKCPRNLRGMPPVQKMGYTSALPAPSVEC